MRPAQALSEVIKNAISYSPPGETVTITVRDEQIDGYQWSSISISDNGPGIPAEELDYIFEDFYRGRNVEQHNIAGAGLGLPIAQVIIKAHGGRITARSAPGRGSTFTVWLPSNLAIIGAVTGGE